jgi:hypothetical protein
MSALCQKQTFYAAVELALFDHLVDACWELRRDFKVKCLGGLLAQAPRLQPIGSLL